MSIGKRIQRARHARKLTQEQLADACGLRALSISRYELDKMKPGAEHLMSLAAALDCTVDSLLFDAPTASSSGTPPTAA